MKEKPHRDLLLFLFKSNYRKHKHMEKSSIINHPEIMMFNIELDALLTLRETGLRAPLLFHSQPTPLPPTAQPSYSEAGKPIDIILECGLTVHWLGDSLQGIQALISTSVSWGRECVNPSLSEGEGTQSRSASCATERT